MRVFLLIVVTILIVIGLQQFSDHRSEGPSRAFQRLVDAGASAEEFEAELGGPHTIEDRQTDICWKYSERLRLEGEVCFSRETGQITTWGQIWN